MGTNLTIDSEAVRDLVAKSILETIGDEQRGELIKQALKSLLEVPKNAYGRVEGESPLQQAFDIAVRGIATSVVTDYLDREEIRESVRALISEAVIGFFKDNDWRRSAIGAAVGHAFTEALSTEMKDAAR